jgi:tetratricopeptide (TPR) repeat protein
MTYAVQLPTADTLPDAAAGLPLAIRESFARLDKLVGARPKKFQCLVLDCRDETLRDRLINDLNERLRLAGRQAAALRLNAQDHPDFAAVEQALRKRAEFSDVIHITGGPSWFDAAKWNAFNIRREAVARHIKASLLLWLDPESVASMAKIAIDLWAWRTAVISFETIPQPPSIPEPDLRIFDNRPRIERTARIDFLRQVLLEPDLPHDIRFGLAFEMGDLLASIGQIAEAASTFYDAANQAPNDRSRAVTMGKIADILQARGQFDEALRIRKEEELPVYDRLGDVRSRAVTMGQIADILQSRGQLDEALRIRQEEELPVYDHLGDVRSRAVTAGKIADILQARGQLDEALRIFRDDVVPVFDHLGDVRARAITMGKIADVLQARGQLDEALRIRQAEELPVYERLGDDRERALTLAKVAQALIEAGGADDARAQEIHAALNDALAIARQCQFAYIIAFAGELLAAVLGKLGHVTEAAAILDHAEAACATLGDTPALERCKKIRSTLAQATESPPPSGLVAHLRTFPGEPIDRNPTPSRAAEL